MTQQDYTTQQDSVNTKKRFPHKSGFHKKRCRWEEKSQIQPNTLAMSELTDPAYRLISVLNALPESWEIIQEDIRLRLRWGEEKMRNAITNLVEHGYMRVMQPRSDDGRFENRDFEFDVHPSFLKEKVPNGGHPQPDTPQSDLSGDFNSETCDTLSYNNVLDKKNVDVSCVQPKGKDRVDKPPVIPQILIDMEEFGLPQEEQEKIAKMKCSEHSIQKACEGLIKYVMKGKIIKNAAAFLTNAIKQLELVRKNNLPESTVWEMRRKTTTTQNRGKA